jgi:hypothetical protein
MLPASLLHKAEFGGEVGPANRTESRDAGNAHHLLSCPGTSLQPRTAILERPIIPSEAFGKCTASDDHSANTNGAAKPTHPCSDVSLPLWSTFLC